MANSIAELFEEYNITDYIEVPNVELLNPYILSSEDDVYTNYTYYIMKEDGDLVLFRTFMKTWTVWDKFKNYSYYLEKVYEEDYSPEEE